MNCTDLAATGLDLAPLLAVGAAILICGLVLLVVARGRRRARTIGALTVLLALGLVCAPIGAPSAQAAEVDCVVDSPDNSLTIVQTSIVSDLAPDADPEAIAGRVTNNSADDTFIVDVTVSIHSVIQAAGAVAGECDATDYELFDPVMPVGAALAAGASTEFEGASIGFVNKETNQNACQRATVVLLYTVG
jgi:hypothetical protein